LLDPNGLGVFSVVEWRLQKQREQPKLD